MLCSTMRYFPSFPMLLAASAAAFIWSAVSPSSSFTFSIRSPLFFLASNSLEENSVESPANWELMDFSSSFFASERLAPESSNTCL